MRTTTSSQTSFLRYREGPSRVTDEDYIDGPPELVFEIAASSASLHRRGRFQRVTAATRPSAVVNSKRGTTTMTTASSSGKRDRAFRARMRAQGLRPIEIWVPDVHSPTFAAEAHRQSLLAAQSATAEEDQAFVDSISDFSE